MIHLRRYRFFHYTQKMRQLQRRKRPDNAHILGSYLARSNSKTSPCSNCFQALLWRGTLCFARVYLDPKSVTLKKRTELLEPLFHQVDTRWNRQNKWDNTRFLHQTMYVKHPRCAAIPYFFTCRAHYCLLLICGWGVLEARFSRNSCGGDPPNSISNHMQVHRIVSLNRTGHFV